MPSKKISFECELCSEICVTTNSEFKRRKTFKDKHYCSSCLIKLNRSKEVYLVLPLDYRRRLLKYGNIPLSVALKFLGNINSKIRVSFGCSICDRSIVIEWSKIRSRKFGINEPICYTCLQKRTQNSAEAVKAHSDRSKGLWIDKDYRSKCLRSFEEHRKRMQIDPEYCNKYKRRSRSIAGHIFIGEKKIRFDSGYELLFIDHYFERCDLFRRCQFSIPYGRRFYHPDFFIEISGVSKIVEVKGFYRNNVSDKKDAANRYIREHGVADQYVLYDTDLLLHENILKYGIGGNRLWKQIKEITNERTIEFAEEKHRKAAGII